MKNFSLISGLLFLCSSAYSQTIVGSVMDSSTSNKISYASIYLNGTYVGTNADQNGYFQLQIPKGFSMPITISSLGYYSGTLTEYYLADTLNIIFLTPKLFELNEVFITAKADPLKRKEYLQLFKNEFLGTSLLARNCKIINEYDIFLSFDSLSGTFKAFSPKPIIINNDYLGYNIEYYLDKFEFRYPTKNGRADGYLVGDSYHGYKIRYFPFKGVIIGNYKYTELKIKNPSHQKRFEIRRKTAYLGSRMHFFRELWRNNLDSAGFEIKDSLNNKIDPSSILIKSEVSGDSIVSKYLKFDGRLFISYYSKKYSTIIKMLKNKTYFNEKGFFDPNAISWEGKMSTERIGDMLPYEYRTKESIKKK
jgi:hypothetical protein